MKIYNKFGKTVHAITLGTKELHYEKFKPVTLGEWTGKEILEEFENSKKRKAIFMSGLSSYDNKNIWKLEKSGKTVFPEAKMAFFQENLKQHGHEQYSVFNDKLRTIGKRFLKEEGYTLEHGIQDTLEIWNSPIIEIEWKHYTPFELYVSSWKFFEFYMPYSEKWKKVKIYEYPLKDYIVEELKFNILIHAVKWLLGDVSEMVSQKLIQVASKKVNSDNHVDLCNNQKDQYQNIDLKYKDHKVSIKSGHTVTSENATKMFKHTPYTHIMGPVIMDILDHHEGGISINSSIHGLGKSFKVKNIVFDDFRIIDRNGDNISLSEFLNT